MFPDYGKHCFVWKSPDGNLLRVFNFLESDNWSDLGTFMWGDLPAKGEPNMSVLLTDATKIQNLCWLHGLAPRVYGIVKVGVGCRKYWAQHVEEVAGEAENDRVAYDVYKKVKRLGAKYGFENEKDDVSVHDVIGGKLVDFNTFHFTSDYKERLARVYREYAIYGKKYYHSVPSLGLESAPRKNGQRALELGLDKIDFGEKSVLDIGCAGGWFCRYVKSRGAGDVVGLDTNDARGSSTILAANIASIMEGFNDIEFMDCNVKVDEVPKDYDIVLFLSMSFHVGVPSWLADATGYMCIVEDNSKGRIAYDELKKMFARVEKVGYTTDRGLEYKLPVYHCYKE